MVIERVLEGVEPGPHPLSPLSACGEGERGERQRWRNPHPKPLSLQERGEGRGPNAIAAR